METLFEILKTGNPVIIDVRNSWEFEEGHIKNAFHIPLDKLPRHLPEIKDFKRPLVVYCRSGNRSGKAVSLLKNAGIADVYNGGSIWDMQQMTYD